MKKLSKTKILILIILLLVLSFHIYRVYFYEDKRWNATVNLPPEQLKIYRDNLNK